MLRCSTFKALVGVPVRLVAEAHTLLVRLDVVEEAKLHIRPAAEVAQTLLARQVVGEGEEALR